MCATKCNPSDDKKDRCPSQPDLLDKDGGHAWPTYLMNILTGLHDTMNKVTRPEC